MFTKHLLLMEGFSSKYPLFYDLLSFLRVCYNLLKKSRPSQLITMRVFSFFSPSQRERTVALTSL